MTKLYNMDLAVQEWRNGNFQRGDRWFSTAIYQCHTCHTQSNEWKMGGWPGMGPRRICEGSQYIEHEALERLLTAQKDLETKIKTYEQTAQEVPIENSQALLQYLTTEHALLQARRDLLRTQFKKEGLDNVVGLDENAEIIPYSCSSRYAFPKKSVYDTPEERTRKNEAEKAEKERLETWRKSLDYLNNNY